MDDLVRELAALGVQAVTPLCPVTEASGADLAAAVLDQSRAVLATSGERAGRDRVLPEQVDLTGAHVAALRRLDDRHGGGALSVRYVTAELRSVLDLVESASARNPLISAGLYGALARPRQAVAARARRRTPRGWIPCCTYTASGIRTDFVGSL